MKKILTIVGARPQFVKAAVLSRLIQNEKDLKEVIVHTGQHYDHNMSDLFFDEMEIPKPNYNLNINGGSQGKVTGEMISKIEEVLLDEKPDWVVLYGDTNSTLAGAIAASKIHIKIAHIEAGLRSFNMRMPEEVNRIITDRVSSVLFCPTDQAVQNLENEGFGSFENDIKNVGDIMYDASLYYSQKVKERTLEENCVLVTCHRAENTNSKKRLNEIVDALNIISERAKVVFPIHPRTKKYLSDYSIKLNFDVIEPVGYLDMLNYIKSSSVVLTDSGGLQKEAYFFKKPCITMRDETEWIELVHNKVNFLCGANKNKIIENFNLVRESNISFPENLYGDGNTGQRIVDYLIKH